MKKISLILIILAMALTITPSTFALISTTPGERRKEIKKEAREAIISGKPGKTGTLNRIKDYVKKNFKFGARVQGTILSIGTNSLSEKGNDGKTYQVNISSTTNLIREFGGKSSL